MVKRFKALFTTSVILLSMTAAWAANYRWTGSQSPDWTDYRNWNKDGSPAVLGEIPGVGDNVEIPSTTHKPEISNAVTIHSVEILAGAEFSIKNSGSGTLTVTTTFTNGGTFNANGKPLTVGGDFTNNGTFNTGSNNDIRLAGKFTNGSNFITAANNTVIFHGANSIIGGSTTTTFANLTIASGMLTLNRDINISGILHNDATLDTGVYTVNFSDTSKISGSNPVAFKNLTISNGSLTLEQDITVTGTFINDGTFTAGTKTVNFTGAASTVKGSGITAFYSLNIASTALSLEREIEITDSFTNTGEVSGGGSILISGNGQVRIQKNINLSGGDSEFKQTGTGTVIIGTATSVPLKITAAKQNYAGAVSIEGDTTFDTAAGTASSPLIFNTDITTKGRNVEFKLPDNGNVTLPSLKVMASSGTTNPLVSIVSNAPDPATVSLTVNGTVTVDNLVPPSVQVQIAAASQTYKGALTLNTNTTFSTANSLAFETTATITAPGKELVLQSSSGKAIIEGQISAGKFTQTGAGAVQIGASIGAPNGISFQSKNLYLVKNADLDPSPAGRIPADCNLFVAVVGSLSFNNELTCNNFILLSGTVNLMSAGPAITASKDIVLFGSGYKADDTASAGIADPSDVTGLFTYNHEKRTGSVNPAGYSAAASLSLPKKLPDETALPTEPAGGFSGALADLTGKTLKAGKNFYANGMNLASTGAWTLDIPNNDVATTAFAEAYFTTVKNCTVSGGGFVAAAEGCTDGGTNAGWDFGRPTITEAYTVSDDTIYVKFNKKIENSNNEIDKAVKYIRFANNQHAFTKAYKDRVCTISTDTQGDLSEFYIRIENAQRWNTDATGTFPGNGDSTCRGGKNGMSTPRHWNTTVDLTIPKAHYDADPLKYIYASLRDEHKNRIQHYSGVNKFTAVKDRCPPVLAAVYTGQEQHVEGSLQDVYDAHNFIEFRYSEPVDIDGTADSDLNKQVTDTLGKITPAGSGIEIAGLGKISSGSLSTGISFPVPLPPPQQPHAWYRKFPAARGGIGSPVLENQACRIRISVAGYVEEPASDPKKWIGYIDSAVSPSGTVTPLNGVHIRSRSTTPQPLDTNFTPKLYTSSSGGQGYVSYHPLASSWDTSPPAFAKVSDGQGDWTDTTNKRKEIASYSSSSQFADKIEFHFFDNTPAYNSLEPWWKTASATATLPGWSSVSDRYDSYGGSRFTGNNRTTGGIRACTLPAPHDVQHVFLFNATNAEFNPALQMFKGTNPAFSLSLTQKAENEAIFGPRPSGFSERDSLYLQLKVTSLGSPLTFPVTETFTVGYQAFDSAHPNGGRITDLAGNMMKTAPLSDSQSIDASPPNIALTVAPVGEQHIYVLFTSQIDTKPETLAKIPRNLKIIGASPGLQIDSTIPARVRTDTKKGTGIIVSLSGTVNYAALSQAKLQVKADGGVIAITPKYGGFPAFAGHKHVISDFAVNVVRPLFAYDEKALDDGSAGFLAEGLYGGTSKAVRLFDGSGVPGNTILEKEDITVHLTVENMNLSDLPQQGTFKMFIDNDPLPSSVSTALNSVTNLGSRVWLPALSAFSPPLPSPPTPTSILPVISETGNNLCEVLSPETPFAGQPQGLYIFKLLNNPASPGSLNYPAGSRAGFLFPMINAAGAYIMIDPDCDGSDPVPLYALRLKDPKDPASIDLWSLDIAAVKQQAGGVSILNNVINTAVRENVVVQITTPKAGSLSVVVMSLDGEVLKILHSGRVEKGEHIYKWNGTNKNGDSVARGIYFIRVAGPGIDETRKVMAVQE